jgi:uncharacterized protein YbbC (DUF1343 family)
MSSIASDTGFRTGMDVLLSEHCDCLAGARIGFVSHRAAVNWTGVSSAERLQAMPGIHLAALFGPEHGFAGSAPAGETTQDILHPSWRIPIYSLYGETRAPTATMLDKVDLLIIEFQDLAARPYTYVSTLRLVLEAAASHNKPVIVADRPIPHPIHTDGPILDPAFSSFVGLIPAPMHYALTPAETASWLRDTLRLPLDLRVMPMHHYHRELTRQPDWPHWVPPSPRIHSWDSACLFTTTVFGEALPALDYGSGTELAFQVIAAPWLDARALIKHLNQFPIAGLTPISCRYRAASGLYADQVLDGIRLTISDHARFRPVSASVLLLEHIQKLVGSERIWSAPDTRPDWFDKLYGTNRVRLALLSGHTGLEIINAWEPDLTAFELERSRHLLYHDHLST